MSAHTPGPWTAGAPAPTSVWAGDQQVASCDWSLICTNCGQPEPDYRAGRGAFNPREVREANAVLIAAAPYMLEILRAVKARVNGVSYNMGADITRLCEAAISKAERLSGDQGGE
jgi:hypothetical protein